MSRRDRPESGQGTKLDRLRLRAFVARLDAGESELDATWSVVADPQIGLRRYRGAAERPPEVQLRAMLATLLARGGPGVLAETRNIAMTQLARLSEPAVAAVGEVVRGEIEDSHGARARIEAARAILGCLGVTDHGGLTIATQINLEDRERETWRGLLKKFDANGAR